MPGFNSIHSAQGFGRVNSQNVQLGRYTTDSLFIHYDFSDVRCYPGTGTTVYDINNTRNGTVSNAIFGGSKEKRYFTFSRTAANTYIRLGTNPPPGLSRTQLTMEAWVYVNSIGSDLGAVISSQYDGATNGSSINTDGRSNPHGSSGTASWHFQSYGSWGISTDSSYGNSEGGSATPSGWVHIVATRDSSGNKYIYRNGQQIGYEGTYAGTHNYDSTYWMIGAEPNGGSFQRYFDGNIAIVRIYNKALTETEISYNFEGQKFRFGYGNSDNTAQTSISWVNDPFGDSSCIAYWRFENNVTDNFGNFNSTFSNINYAASPTKLGSYCGVFNGTSNTVTLSSIKNSYPFSVSAWVTNASSWTASSGTMQQIFNLNINSQRVSLGIVNNPGWVLGPCLFYGGTSHYSGRGPTYTGKTASTDWHHLVWVVNGSDDSANHAIYLDGYPITLANNGGNHGGTAGWAIGSNSASGEYWNGQIDEVRFFNRKLTISEIQNLYSGSTL